MLGRLVKQFVKRGARDHLSARRVQEEADLHRLFVLTAFQRAEGDGPELVQRVMAEAEVPYTAFKYAENSGQMQPIREQAGTFADSIKLWSA